MAAKFHDARGRFTAGNPGGGRRKMPAEFLAALQAETVEALRVIVQIMRDEEAPPAIRLKAAESIISRAYGSSLELLVTEPLKNPFGNFLNFDMMEEEDDD